MAPCWQPQCHRWLSIKGDYIEKCFRMKIQTTKMSIATVIGTLETKCIQNVDNIFCAVVFINY